MIVVDSGGACPALRDPNAPPPIKAEELRGLLMPGLEVVFGTPLPRGIVAKLGQV